VNRQGASGHRKGGTRVREKGKRLQVSERRGKFVSASPVAPLRVRGGMGAPDVFSILLLKKHVWEGQLDKVLALAPIETFGEPLGR
jgi:hypothetical protein